MINPLQTAEEKIEFRQIVLSHIKRILEISSHELRDTTFTIIHSNYSETKYQEDTRNSYIQSIENLAYVLKPYFDEKIKKVYDNCIKVLNGWGFEINKICKKRYDEICKGMEKKRVDEIFDIEMRIDYAKRLFISLNKLLHRNDYLKSAIYGEDTDEFIEESKGKKKKKKNKK